MLKTVDIENANEGRHTAQDLLRGKTLVDNFDKPIKQTRVDKLGNGITND